MTEPFLPDVKLTPEQDARAVEMGREITRNYLGSYSVARVIVHLQDQIETCGLQCSATMKSLMAELEQLKQDLHRTESARVALLAENTHYKQEAARSSLDAKIGGALMGRGFYDRMQDQTDEDTAARIVHEFLEVAKPIVSAHYRRALPPEVGFDANGSPVTE